jgi:hypothetical protein
MLEKQYITIVGLDERCYYPDIKSDFYNKYGRDVFIIDEYSDPSRAGLIYIGEKRFNHGNSEFGFIMADTADTPKYIRGNFNSSFPNTIILLPKRTYSKLLMIDPEYQRVLDEIDFIEVVDKSTEECLTMSNNLKEKVL